MEFFTVYNIGVKFARLVQTTLASRILKLHCCRHKSSPLAPIRS